MTELTEISELERRITKAMDRVSQGLEKLAPAGAGAAAAELQAALEAERGVVAQLRVQLANLQDKHAAEMAALRAQADTQVGQMSALDAAMQQLRAANDQLRDNNGKLREANSAGVGDAGLINAGMEAELRAIRAAREADRAEADAILTALRPLVDAAKPALGDG